MPRYNHLLSLPERFWLNVEKSAGCWEWIGAKRSTGYGQIVKDHRNYLAHRVAWELTNGPIPDGMFVCHHCDNRTCVRPDHLFLGTTTDNMRDMVAKGRHFSRTKPERYARGERSGSVLHPEGRHRGDQHWSRRNPDLVPKGENVHTARLTPDDVRDMRRMRENGMSFMAIATAKGVAKATARTAIIGKTWAHVE